MLIQFRKPRLRADLFAGLLLFLLPAGFPALAADHQEEQWFEAVGRRDWLANYDPTLIGRRATAEFSYEDERKGKSTTKLDPTIRDAWGITESLAFGIQVEQPVKWLQTGSGSIAGAGDFECRTGIVGRITSSLRWGTAMNFKFPTASNPALGVNAFEIRPIAAISWDTTTWLNLGINAAYSITTADTETVNKLELKFPVAVKISSSWSAELTYKPTLNFAAETTTHSLEIDITRLLGDKHQFAISPGIEVPLSVQSLEWKAILGMAWYF